MSLASAYGWRGRATPKQASRVRIAARLLMVAALAALTAGCFQPMYAEHSDGTPGLREKLMGIDLPPIDKPNASRDARLGVEIRNALAFKLYGSATGMPPTHRLVIRFNTTRSSLMVDPTTALPSSENYAIDAQYNLIEIASNKSVMTGTTFSRVSYDIPGQLQRFARARAFRDAEDRAAQEIADNIQTRLASFFVAGT
jgi:LPS-assembly lipoprotein